MFAWNGYHLNNPNPIWKDYPKFEVTRAMAEEHLVPHFANHVFAHKQDIGYGYPVVTSEKTLCRRHDGIFDLRVRNATYACLTTEEKSETFTPIEFVSKDGVLVLEGCDLDHPLFLPFPGHPLCIQTERFRIDTDGDTIEYRPLIFSKDKFLEFYHRVMISRSNWFPSVLANGRVILVSLGYRSFTFFLSETSPVDDSEFKGALLRLITSIVDDHFSHPPPWVNRPAFWAQMGMRIFRDLWEKDSTKGLQTGDKVVIPFDVVVPYTSEHVDIYGQQLFEALDNAIKKLEAPTISIHALCDFRSVDMDQFFEDLREYYKNGNNQK